MSCSGAGKKTGSWMEEEASAQEASCGTEDLAGSPDGLQETSVERRGLSSTSGHHGDFILEILCLEPFCSPTCFRL